jgi:FtsH-binding integral membrane protein
MRGIIPVKEVKIMALFPQNPQSPWGSAAPQAQAATYDTGLRQYMLGVYNYMASALLLTAIVAWFASHSATFMNALFVVHPNGSAGMSMLGLLVAFAPLAFVLFFSFRLQAMSFRTAQAVFWAYAAVMGLSLSSLLLVYTGASIAQSFLVSAIMFGSVSLYGYTTKRDLTGMGTFLIMGLWGVILASVVNIFMHSAGLEFVVSIVCVLVFTGLAAYDTQKLKAIYYQVAGTDREIMGKTALMGALNLYLDFINLFIAILRLTGNRR